MFPTRARPRSSPAFEFLGRADDVTSQNHRSVVAPLADASHALVIETAQRLCQGATTPREKLERIFFFVRDDIAFGFPTDGDFVPAHTTLSTGIGQCNTKATLFLALCRASEIPARIHFSLIKKQIQKGFFTGIAYWLVPPFISHSWLEVEIEGKWRRIDSFINDAALHDGATKELRRRGWKVGYSIALSGDESDDAVGAGLDLDHETFEQMAAVTDDHGTWEDPADYYASALYQNRPGALKLWFYRRMIGSINRRVRRVRSGQTLG